MDLDYINKVLDIVVIMLVSFLVIVLILTLLANYLENKKQKLELDEELIKMFNKEIFDETVKTMLDENDYSDIEQDLFEETGLNNMEDVLKKILSQTFITVYLEHKTENKRLFLFDSTNPLLVKIQAIDALVSLNLITIEEVLEKEPDKIFKEIEIDGVVLWDFGHDSLALNIIVEMTDEENDLF